MRADVRHWDGAQEDLRVNVSTQELLAVFTTEGDADLATAQEVRQLGGEIDELAVRDAVVGLQVADIRAEHAV